MAAAPPSTFVELCAAEGLTGAGSTDLEFKTYLENSAILPEIPTGNNKSHKTIRKELAHTLLWLRAQLGKPDALNALPPVMQQSVKGLYALRADQRAAATWATFVLTVVGTYMAERGDTPVKAARLDGAPGGVQKRARRLEVDGNQGPPQLQPPQEQQSHQPLLRQLQTQQLSSQQQPLQSPSPGATVSCTDDALKAVLTPDIYHFIYLGAGWTTTQLRDYRKLQDTMKGLDQVDDHLDPMWAHRINLFMGPKLDKMDLGRHAKHLAIIVNWDSADRHRVRDVLAYAQDSRLESIERRNEQLTQRYERCLASARCNVKIGKDTWDAVVVLLVAMMHDRAADLQRILVDGSPAAREIITRSSGQVTIVGKFLTDFFERVNYESSTKQPHDQSAFHNGRLVAMLAPSVDAVLNSVPYSAQTDSFASALAGLITPAHLSGPAGGGYIGHAFQGGAPGFGAFAGGAGPFSSASGVAGYSGGGPAYTPPPAYIPPPAYMPSQAYAPSAPQTYASLGSPAATSPAAPLPTAYGQGQGSTPALPTAAPKGKLAAGSLVPPPTSQHSQALLGAPATSASQAFIGKPVSEALVGRSRAILDPTKGKKSVRCGCNKVAEPHFCWECPLKYFQRFSMCPGYLPNGQRNPHAWIGNELAPPTLVLWKSIVGHVPAALTALGKEVNFD